MPVRFLDEQKTWRLRSAPLSFTRHAGSEGDAPAGYNHLNSSVTLARRDFDAAARDLFEWRMHSRAGLQVHASDIPLRQRGSSECSGGGGGAHPTEHPQGRCPERPRNSGAGPRTALEEEQQDTPEYLHHDEDRTKVVVPAA